MNQWCGNAELHGRHEHLVGARRVDCPGVYAVPEKRRWHLRVEDDFVHAATAAEARAEFIQALAEDPSLIYVTGPVPYNDFDEAVTAAYTTRCPECGGWRGFAGHEERCACQS